MQANRTYTGGNNRGSGFSDIRDRAYVEGLKRLSKRSSLATRLTQQQVELTKNDYFFEIYDESHKVIRAGK